MSTKPNPNINMIVASFTGVLSDSIPLQTPMLIPNESRLIDILISAISAKKPKQNEDGTWELEDNTDDIFVNKQYTINFLKQDVIVVRGAKIDKVNIVDGNYRVTYAPEILKDYEYFACIVRAPSGCAKPKGLTWENEKPGNEHICDERVFIP